MGELIVEALSFENAKVNKHKLDVMSRIDFDNVFILKNTVLVLELHKFNFVKKIVKLFFDCLRVRIVREMSPITTEHGEISKRIVQRGGRF